MVFFLCPLVHLQLLSQVNHYFTFQEYIFQLSLRFHSFELNMDLDVRSKMRFSDMQRYVFASWCNGNLIHFLLTIYISITSIVNAFIDVRFFFF